MVWKAGQREVICINKGEIHVYVDPLELSRAEGEGMIARSRARCETPLTNNVPFVFDQFDRLAMEQATGEGMPEGKRVW